MNIFDLNIVLITLFALVCWVSQARSSPVTCKEASTCAAVVSAAFVIQWLAISGLRHVSVGADTIAYYNRYLNTSVTPAEWIFDDIYRFYASFFSAVKDPGYALIEKIAQAAGLDYQWFLLIVAASFILPFTLMVFKNSKAPYLSFLIYSTLFYEFYSVTGNRQTIAAGIILLVGLRAIFERRLVLFLVTIFALSCIHKSLLIFLPAYFIFDVRPTRAKFAIASITLPILFVMRETVVGVLSALGGYEQYGEIVESSPWAFSAALIAVSAAVVWRLPYMVTSDRRVWFYINSILMSVLMLPILFTNPVAMRAIQYYSIFLVLLIPEVVASFGTNDRKLVTVAISAILIGLFVIAGNEVPYSFFWEGRATIGS